jgi:hypothetical protein
MIEHLESEPAARAAVDRFARDGRERRAWPLTRVVAFKDQGDARMRRQIVRWLGREYHEATPGIVETLRSALEDPDWEVRVSAIIVTARIRAQTLHAAVRATVLPSQNEHGLSERDIRVLVASRIIAAESLASANPDDMDRAQVILRQLSDARATSCAACSGSPSNSTTTRGSCCTRCPRPTSWPTRSPIRSSRSHGVRPACVAVRSRRAVLGVAAATPGGRRSSALGASSEDVRRARAHTGHGVLHHAPPPHRRRALQLGIGPFPQRQPADATLTARLADTPDAPLALGHDEALSLCEQISARMGTVVTLPTADELECAARARTVAGTRGGMGSRRWTPRCDRRTASSDSPRRSRSGRTRAPQRVPLVLGGPLSPHCAGRAPSMGANAVRPVVRDGGTVNG